jgi:gliding motility associated protien GldN
MSNEIKKCFCTILLVLTAFSQSIAQQPTPHNIREADVMWSTTIWRELDLKQKINQPLYYPLEPADGYMSLFDAFLNEIEEGYLTAYSTGPLGDQDNFSIPLSPTEVKSIIISTDTIFTEDPDTEEMIPQVQENVIESSDIARYRIKEEWIFDKQRSRMVPRIIGIAPMATIYGEDGEVRGLRTLFWVRFDQAKFGLQFYPVFIRHNNNKGLNYSDIFAKRFFDSYVTKESNVQNRFVNEYANGVDALLESDRIEEGIRTFESDLWDH